MRDGLVLGIDIGTSSCKAGVYSPGGECLALEKGCYSMLDMPDGRIEYDPEVWVKSVKGCIKKITSSGKINSDEIKAIGFSAQMGTHIIVGEDGNPLRPAISWQDGRAHVEVETLKEIFPGDELDSEIGGHLPSGAAWPLPRIMWMLRNEKENMYKAQKWLQPKDYVIFRLTGEYCSDMSSLRGVVNPYTGKVSPVVIDRLELKNSVCLPDISEPWGIAGRIGSKAASDMGLAPGTPVITGWNDFNSALLGTGITGEGDAYNITGTSDHIGMIVSPVDGAADPSLVRYPYLAGTLDLLYGVTSSGGSSMDWFVKSFNCIRDGQSFGEAVNYILSQGKGSKGLIFLPYLRGERAPIWDTDARGMFFGIDGGHRINNFMCAVMEGVAFSLRHILELTGAHMGSIKSIRVSGGAAVSDAWNQAKADILKKPIVSTECADSSCLGAAILAAVGTGWYQDIKSAAMNMVRKDKEYVPDSSKFEYFDGLFQIYKSLYSPLKESYRSLSKIKNAVFKI